MIEITKENYANYIFIVSTKTFLGFKMEDKLIIREYTVKGSKQFGIKRPGGTVVGFFKDLKQALAYLYSENAKIKKIEFEEYEG